MNEKNLKVLNIVGKHGDKDDRRTLSITIKLLLNAIYTILFFIYYCNLVRRATDGTFAEVNYFVILSCFLIIIITKNTRKDIEDEFVHLAIRKIDSISFKITALFLIVIMFFAGFEIVPMDVFGYMIGIYFILLDLLRPVIYCVYNKRGIKMTKLRTKIKILREQENMNQGELANQLGVKIETIVHLENGKYNPSLKMGIDIAKVFHTTVEDIFEFVEE